MSNLSDDGDSIPVGVSHCLLGEKVRYDGSHKRDLFLTEMLGRYVRFVGVCPEFELGLGIPREPVNLRAAASGVRLVKHSGEDITDAMQTYAHKRLRELEALDLCGFIFKKDSPSCGVFRVKVYDRNDVPSRTGRGVFAAALIEAFPNLPIEEEGRLQDAKLRENFVVRIFAYRRLKAFFALRRTNAELTNFHAREKLLLLAHEPLAYQKLGRLVAHAKSKSIGELRAEYSSLYMTALARPATAGRNTNVLQHMAGYFKKEIDAKERAELSTVIADYRLGLIPLIVPLTLIQSKRRPKVPPAPRLRR